MSYAKQQKLETQAILAGQNISPANVDLSNLPVYDQMLGLLNMHKYELGAIQSRQKRNAQKAIYLKEYKGYLNGLLAQKRPQPQNDVLAQIMLWAFDTGDFALALKLFEFGIKNNFIMPAPQKRTFATAGIEEAAETWLKAFANNEKAPFCDIDQLKKMLELVEEYKSDMPDEVKAKLHKALGEQFLKKQEFAQAQKHLQTALKLDDKSGVKTLIRQLEKHLKIED